MQSEYSENTFKILAKSSQNSVRHNQNTVRIQPESVQELVDVVF